MFSASRPRTRIISERPLSGSICGLKFTRALDLPTFTLASMILLKRMVLIVDDGVIGKVFYPVFPPDKSAAEVVAFLRQSQR
jgi:peroxiredoxin